MKAIETLHKGIMYRSRTEARWAVFMDALGIRHSYEPEGFDLGEDGWYLPDFWLPDLDVFLEIKPEIISEGRSSPTEALSKHTGKAVYTFFGSPYVFGFCPDNYSENGYVDLPCGGSDYDYAFCVCPHCGMAGIEFNGRTDRIDCDCPKSPHGDKGYNHEDPRIIDALFLATNQKFTR